MPSAAKAGSLERQRGDDHHPAGMVLRVLSVRTELVRSVLTNAGDQQTMPCLQSEMCSSNRRAAKVSASRRIPVARSTGATCRRPAARAISLAAATTRMVSSLSRRSSIGGTRRPAGSFASMVRTTASSAIPGTSEGSSRKTPSNKCSTVISRRENELASERAKKMHRRAGSASEPERVCGVTRSQ